MKRKTEIFNEKMENFSEIRFTNTVWELNVNVVAKADGDGGVELFRKNFFGELLPYGGRIDKREFLEGFKKLSVGNWKKTYKGKGKIVNGQEWQLEIVFGEAVYSVSAAKTNARRIISNFRGFSELLLPCDNMRFC